MNKFKLPNVKFILPEKRRVDLTVISKESNITSYILDNFVDNIIRTNLEQVYECLEPEFYKELSDSIKEKYECKIKFGILDIHLKDTEDFIVPLDKKYFTRSVFICPECGNAYLLNTFEENFIDDSRYECPCCNNMSFDIKLAQDYRKECADETTKKLIKKCIHMRKEKNIRLYDMARRIGISNQSLITIEKGRCNPNINIILRYLDILGIDINKLFN